MRFNEYSQPEQLDELSWKDIQKGAKKVSKGAQKFTKNVADTGAAVGQAAKDVGGAIKQVGKTAIADPVAATYNAAKGGLSKAADVTSNVYGDVKAGAQKVGKGISTAQTDLGNAAKFAGNTAAKAVGGTAGAVGAVAGGATTGVGRAAAHGFNAGVQNTGGDAVDRLETNVFKKGDVQGIKDAIVAKQTEIASLEKQLTQAQKDAADASTGSTAPDVPGGSFAKGFAKGLGADALSQNIDQATRSNTGGAEPVAAPAPTTQATPAPAVTTPAPTTATTAPAPNFSRGQQAVAPSKVSYNITPPKKPATTQQRPAAEPVAESVDIAEALWRKMKSKR